MQAQLDAINNIPRRFQTPVSALDVVASVDLSGKLAVVTGGSGGIGLPTALALATAGADVAVVSRGGDKLREACRTLRAAVSSHIEEVPADLMSLASVDAAADRILALGRPVDIVVNNAGVIGPLIRNDLGIESGFMVNVVAHAVLASRLAPVLANGARVVCVSSFGHHASPVRFDDINFENRPYEPWLSYGQSKTGCALLAIKVSRSLKARGIDAFSLHPGAIATDMSRSMTDEDRAFIRERGSKLSADDFVTLEEGAATSVWAATEPLLAGHGGLYLENCHVAEVVTTPNYYRGVMPHALDAEQADRLWKTIGLLIGRPLPL